MSYSALTPFQDSSANAFTIPAEGAFQSSSHSPSSDQNPLNSFPWSSPERLTISFAPDGTRISSYQSSLFESFRDLMTRQQLEAQVLKAFQQWARHSSINIGLTTDSGDRFGINAPTQGDQRFGDIRVGAIPLAPDVYAVSIKHDTLVSGSWAGDILFNANQTFTSIDHFYAVALHEAGHVLGLSHSTDPLSVMHPTSTRTQLSGLDIVDIRKRYGYRRMDLQDVGDKNNNSLEKSTRIKNPGSLHGQIPLIVYGDLHVSADVDYFDLPPLSGYHGPITFELVTAGISLLRARLSIFNEGGHLLQSAAIGGIRGGRVSLTIPQASPGETYYAKIEAVDRSLFSVGSYALKATFEDNLNVDPALIERVLTGNFWRLSQNDVQGIFLNPQSYHFRHEFRLNDSLNTAESLETTAAYNDRQHYQVVGSFSYLRDRDFYQFQTPDELPSGHTMTITLTALEGTPFVPRLAVFDAHHVAQPTKTLVNGNGQLTIQVSHVQPDQTYFVRAMADWPGDSFDQGNYQLTIRFDQPSQVLPKLAQGSLSSDSPTNRTQYHSLYVAETQMLHLALTASSSSTREFVQVWVTIYDRKGRPVFRALTVPGQTRTAKSVILRPGSYTVFVSLATDLPSQTYTLDYSIRGVGITDPIGPELLNPANKPFKKAGPNDPNYVYPGNLHSPNTFVVVQGNAGITPPSLIKEPPFVDPNAWYWYPGWLTTEVPPL